MSDRGMVRRSQVKDKDKGTEGRERCWWGQHARQEGPQARDATCLPEAALKFQTLYFAFQCKREFLGIAQT